MQRILNLFGTAFLAALIVIGFRYWEKAADAGTGSLSTVSAGQIIRASHHNSIISAAKEDWVPRNSSGVATDEGGNMGTATYRWKRAYIVAGYLPTGSIMPWYDYNGAITLPQGWMTCDGSIVNETNYDTQHTAGDWDEYVVSSPLDGKYLPNLNDKALHGTTGSTQAGSGAITFAGNASHQVNIAHTHTLNHNHQWMIWSAISQSMSSYDSGGTAAGLDESGTCAANVNLVTGGADCLAGFDSNEGWTADNDGEDTSTSSLSSTQSVKDHGLAVKMIMKVVDE